MPDEKLIKLAKLSQRERQVLWFVCDGLSYKEISQKLYIAVPTVKADMGRVYVKLELDTLKPAERVKAIHQVYCELLKEAELPPEVPQPEILLIPAHVAEMVDEDERSIIPFEPGENFRNKTTPKTEIITLPPPKRSRGCLWLLAGLVLGLLITVYFLINNNGLLNQGQSQQALELTKVVEQLTQLAQTPLQEATAIATFTPKEVVVVATQPAATATNEAVVVVVTATPPPATVAPTQTSAPTLVLAPSIPLPFNDDFQNGANSLWQVLNGDWLVADGRYTISNADNKLGLSVLDDPRWTNYRIKVNIKLEKSDEGEVAVIVRYLSSSNKYLVFNIVNIFSKGGFATYSGSEMNYIAGYGSVAIPHEFDLEIDATENNFVAKINGMVTEQINLSGFEQGGVGLGISCFYPPCASYDDFQVTTP